MLAALRARSRDNARTPMQWDASPQAGFTDRDAVAAGQPEPRRSTPPPSVDDPDSVLAHYRALIALRHDEPAVAHGDFTMLLPEHEQVYAFTRAYEDRSCWCLQRLGPAGVVHAGRPGAVGLGPAAARHARHPGTGTLQPWESRVLRRSTA